MARQEDPVGDAARPDDEDLATMREDFDFNDANHDGRITFGEFVRFMSALEAGMTAEECRIGFEEIDSDHDGAISFEEFVAWWGQE